MPRSRLIAKRSATGTNHNILQIDRIDTEIAGCIHNRKAESVAADHIRGTRCRPAPLRRAIAAGVSACAFTTTGADHCFTRIEQIGRCRNDFRRLSQYDLNGLIRVGNDRREFAFVVGDNVAAFDGVIGGGSVVVGLIQYVARAADADGSDFGAHGEFRLVGRQRAGKRTQRAPNQI